MKGVLGRFLLLATATAFLLTSNVLASATDYYASPNGTSNGKGTIASPWDIVTALQSSRVKGGDTVWLRGGTYGTGGSLIYECTLTGRSESQPIIVRQYRGERAQLNGALNVTGSHVWFWGFELTNSSPQRAVSNIDTERPRGIVISAKSVGVKVINMAIHDVGRAGVGGGGNNYEVYGTLFWGNGIDDGREFRGDAIYVNLWHQPPQAGVTNRIRDNIGFRNFYSGFKVYTEWADVYIDGYDIEGNVSFDNGSRSSEYKAQANFLVRSEKAGPPIRRLRVSNNYSYRTPDSTNPYNAEFGCVQVHGTECEDAVITDNYFVGAAGGIGILKASNWRNLAISGNTVVGTDKGTLVTWTKSPRESARWDGNSYFGGAPKPFKFSAGDEPEMPLSDGKKPKERWDSLSASEWTSASADRSSLRSGRPSGLKVEVLGNVYEPGERANIIVYNWDKKPFVAVDLGPTDLADGTQFEIVDAQNYFGDAVLTGTFHARSPLVNIPMNLSKVAALVGSAPHMTVQHTAPEFAVFVLRKLAAVEGK